MLINKVYIQLKDIKVGDNVKIIYAQKYFIIDHDFIKIENIKFTFADNTSVILTEKHLVYNINNKFICSD